MNDFKELREKIDDFILLSFIKFQSWKEEQLNKLEQIYAEAQQKNK